MKKLYEPIATAVRIECDSDNDDVFIVFKITDEKFKQEVKKDWSQDIEVKVKGRDLVKA
jgi:hypothetical protein